MKKILHVGIIGFGMIGKVHAYSYAALPYYLDGAALPFAPKITHIATAHKETAAKACETAGCQYGVTDFREITENPEIDIVHICSPNQEHRAALLSAIEHQKYIFCDKPLCSTLDEALEVEFALEKTGPDGRPFYRKTSQMMFHLRFYPAIRRARQIIESGRLGRIFEYRICYRHSSGTSENVPFKWKHAQGGGAILDLGAHLFDLIDSLIGLPEELIAEAQTAYAERPDKFDASIRHAVSAEDAVTILTRGIDSASGQPYRGLIEASKLAAGREDELELEISGSSGAVRFSLLNPHFLEYFDGTASDRPYGGNAGWQKIAAGARFESPELDFPSAKSSIGWVRGHVSAVANFLTAIAKDEPGNPNLRQGIRIQRILNTAAVSAAARCWTPVEWGR